MIKEYIKIPHYYEDNCFYTYKPLKPTGRWKIEIVNNKRTLFIEHKGWLFKRWIYETNIVIRNEETYINNCGE